MARTRCAHPGCVAMASTVAREAADPVVDPVVHDRPVRAEGIWCTKNSARCRTRRRCRHGDQRDRDHVGIDQNRLCVRRARPEPWRHATEGRRDDVQREERPPTNSGSRQRPARRGRAESRLLEEETQQAEEDDVVHRSNGPAARGTHGRRSRAGARRAAKDPRRAPAIPRRSCPRSRRSTQSTVVARIAAWMSKAATSRPPSRNEPAVPSSRSVFTTASLRWGTVRATRASNDSKKQGGGRTRDTAWPRPRGPRPRRSRRSSAGEDRREADGERAARDQHRAASETVGEHPVGTSAATIVAYIPHDDAVADVVDAVPMEPEPQERHAGEGIGQRGERPQRADAEAEFAVGRHE